MIAIAFLGISIGWLANTQATAVIEKGEPVLSNLSIMRYFIIAIAAFAMYANANMALWLLVEYATHIIRSLGRGSGDIQP